MKTYAAKTQESKSQSVANPLRKQQGGASSFQPGDDRAEAVAQRKLQEMANSSSGVRQLGGFRDGANARSPAVLQRQVHGSSQDNVTPWDLVAEWLNQGMFEQFTPTVSRAPFGLGANVSEDCDIEFAWAGTYFYDGQGYTVRAHLHVRNGAAVVTGGGIWVTGLVGQGGNWNTLAGHNYLVNFMTPYME